MVLLSCIKICTAKIFCLYLLKNKKNLFVNYRYKIYFGILRYIILQSKDMQIGDNKLPLRLIHNALKTSGLHTGREFNPDPFPLYTSSVYYSASYYLCVTQTHTQAQPHISLKVCLCKTDSYCK